MSAHRNWIAGSWSPAASGLEFDARRHGVWPRSGAEDVAAALEGAERGASEWSALSPRARADKLGEVLDLWEDEGAGEARFAAAIGLEPEELDSSCDAALELGDELIAAGGAATGGGVVVARAAASGLGAALVQVTFPSLLAGSGVLLFSDADAPELAVGLCELFEDVGLPKGVVSLVHDDASTSLRAALASGAVSRLALAEPAERIASAERALERACTGASSGGFGSGLREQERPQLEATVLRQRQHVVHLEDSLEAAAATVAEGAFGRGVLTGQAAGAIGRVLCHERLFSRFTEALLARVDDLALRCRPFDRGLPQHLSERLRLGLDEGATLIRGGSREPAGSQRRSRDAILGPSVFTNVEPRMALSRADRPAPVLCLLRLGSDDEALSLARRLSE